MVIIFSTTTVVLVIMMAGIVLIAVFTEKTGITRISQVNHEILKLFSGIFFCENFQRTNFNF